VCGMRLRERVDNEGTYQPVQRYSSPMGFSKALQNNNGGLRHKEKSSNRLWPNSNGQEDQFIFLLLVF